MVKHLRAINTSNIESFFQNYRSSADNLKEEKISRMTSFLSYYSNQKNYLEKDTLARISSFLEQYSDLNLQGITQGVKTFNVFTLLDIGADELKHSSFLAWLLNLRKEHGQGNLFLQCFFRACGIDIPINVIDKYIVRTEFPGWESIIDILIYQKGSFILYIENKIFSNEGEGQIDREYRDMHRLADALMIPREMRFPIFLTPSRKTPISGDGEKWTCLSYRRIQEEFAKELISITDEKTKYLISDWLSSLNNFMGA